WDVYQFAMAFIANSNTVITKEIPETIRLKCTTNLISRQPEQIAISLFQTLEKIDEESQQYPCLTHALHRLSHMLETKRLSFKSIVKFPDRAEVKDILRSLRTEFANKLPQEENSDQHQP